MTLTMANVSWPLGVSKGDEQDELLRAAQRGSGDAFGALVRPHLGTLHRIATRICRNSSLAEDAVQECLTIAYRKLGSLLPQSSVRAFLATVVIKRAHTLVRSERRRRAREDSAAAPARAATPQEMMEASAIQETIHAALSGMPAKRRKAALLRLDGGLSYKEIATSLRTSEGSARVLVHLAIKQLKQALSETLEQPS